MFDLQISLSDRGDPFILLTKNGTFSTDKISNLQMYFFFSSKDQTSDIYFDIKLSHKKEKLLYEIKYLTH